MDMGGMDHGGMDMGGGGSSKPACKISMLWNWNTVDSCFISSTWQIRSKGMFAGSVIGIFLLVIAIEAVRRGAREYDRYITRRALSARATGEVLGSDSPVAGGSEAVGGGTTKLGDTENGQVVSALYARGAAPYTPTWVQQLLRAFVYGSQFSASFMVMLLGMYYNGYILIAIFIGHTVGYFIFGRDTCAGVHPEGTGSGHCC